MSFQYPVINTADQIPACPFSLSCHQFAITVSPSGAIFDDVLEWDEGKMRSHFILPGWEMV